VVYKDTNNVNKLPYHTQKSDHVLYICGKRYQGNRLKRMKIVLITILAAFTIIQVKSQSKNTWFSYREVEKNVWLINDNNAANIYLITGSDSALVVDPGTGVADLNSLLKKITAKPLIIINTHCHRDHAGANYQFQKVYIHPSDSSSARNTNLPENRSALAKSILRGKSLKDDELFSEAPFHTKLLPLKEGHIFNLGNRLLEVIETPGHTRGGICLLDSQNRLLFCGDNNISIVRLFLENSVTLHEYLLTLEKQYKRKAEFTTLYPGHGNALPSDFILDQISCVREIIEGKCDPKPYRSSAGNGMICTFGAASVSYDPENL
jgi:glyoxylase-like metal-dependent hydrolase (beta-lactamase superfamily II)